MSTARRLVSRRRFLQAALATGAAPLVLPATIFGQGGRAAPSNRITMGCIGMGGRGSGDMQSFLGFGEIQVTAVCDVVQAKRERAKATVDKKYGTADCRAVNDFREILARPDIDTVMIGTPDHWHATISILAMQHGKDVFCEKPETLTIREGRKMVEVARRYGRVFSGGSQRVWGDYNWFHRMVRGGAIGQVKEVFVDCGGPSNDAFLPEQPIPPGLDWDMYLGPAPYKPFNQAYLTFRPWRDYSGGGMTDWGAHNFGGALFACNLHETGPVEVIPPDGKDNPLLTFKFASGVVMHHKGGWGGNLCFRGTEGEIPTRGVSPRAARREAPNIYIPNYKGGGSFFGDFVHCVKTRERPFRDIELAHRTVTVCHLGNIAYWTRRRIQWDPVKEEIIGDETLSRWLDRPKRSPWTLM